VTVDIGKTNNRLDFVDYCDIWVAGKKLKN